MESACDSCSCQFMKFPTFPDFRRILHRSQPPIRKLVVIQARHGKALQALAEEFGIGTRTIRTWLRLYACCGFQALGHKSKPGRHPCLSHDPMQMILETLRDKAPDQLQFEFAYRSLQIVRPWTLDQFPVQLSLATVRRVLRRLGLTPQRPQFRACQPNAAAVRTGIAATCPALARHAQEQGALLLWADEAGRISHYHRGTPWGPRGQTPVVQPPGERFRLHRLSASSPLGAIHSRIHSGTAAAATLKQLLQQIPDQTDARPIYVLVDRHSIHTSKPMEAWQKRTEAPVEIHLLPAYSPAWNPAELVRSVVQRRVGKLLVRTVRQLRERWEEALQALEADPAKVPGVLSRDRLRLDCFWLFLAMTYGKISMQEQISPKS